ncbi:MAG: ATP-binding protein [Candidatus Helarchaeota archaeon]|nr:ATP-binding protein [Candidatus Helarchaeota archaeon]
MTTDIQSTMLKAKNCEVRAATLIKKGNYPAALMEIRKAIGKYELLVARYPNSPLYNDWYSKLDDLKGYEKKLEGRKEVSIETIKEGTSVSTEECAEVGERVDPETNKLDFSKLAGMEKIKKILRRTIEWSLKEKEKMEEHGLEPTKGILLVGPPGCGKTYLVKCAAGEFKIRLLIASPASTFNKYVGETPKAVRKVFQCGEKLTPSIIFVDEIDKLLPDPSRSSDSSGVTGQALSTFQQEMDGAQSGTGFIVMMATNDPELLHPALSRTGRVSYRLYIPPPDKPTRAAVFRINLDAPKLILDPEVKNFDLLADLTAPQDGWYYASSDIEEICRRAKEKRFEMIIESGNEEIPLTLDMLKDAIQSLKPSISPKQHKRYEKWANEFSG